MSEESGANLPDSLFNDFGTKIILYFHRLQIRVSVELLGFEQAPMASGSRVEGRWARECTGVPWVALEATSSGT